MSWNYRVVKKEIDGHIQYGIHEVYYKDDGSIMFATQDAVKASVVEQKWDELSPLEYLKENLEHMLMAFRGPVIDYDDIPDADFKELEGHE